LFEVCFSPAAMGANSGIRPGPLKGVKKSRQVPLGTTFKASLA